MGLQRPAPSRSRSVASASHSRSPSSRRRLSCASSMGSSPPTPRERSTSRNHGHDARSMVRSPATLSMWRCAQRRGIARCRAMDEITPLGARPSVVPRITRRGCSGLVATTRASASRDSSKSTRWREGRRTRMTTSMPQSNQQSGSCRHVRRRTVREALQRGRPVTWRKSARVHQW